MPGNRRDPVSRDGLYTSAVREFGEALDRLCSGYESDPEKRKDLRQDIYLQLWRSLELFDGRCSLRTWTFRVAHNTAVSYVTRERRGALVFASLEDLDAAAPPSNRERDIDRRRALDRLAALIRGLRPLDRQIMLLYLEDMDPPAIAEITGLTPANVSMKVHRTKNVLARHFGQEARHV